MLSWQCFPGSTFLEALYVVYLISGRAQGGSILPFKALDRGSIIEQHDRRRNCWAIVEQNLLMEYMVLIRIWATDGASLSLSAGGGG